MLDCCRSMAGMSLIWPLHLDTPKVKTAPIYEVKIPPGYRDWRLISVNHLAGGNLKQVRAQLGNDIAITAFREGKLPFPVVVGDMNMAQPTTSTAYGFRSFTDFPAGPIAINPSWPRSSARTSGSIRRR